MAKRGTQAGSKQKMSVDGQSEGNRPSPPPTHLNIASWNADKSFRRCHIDFFAHCLAQKLDVITVIDYGHHLYVNFEYIKDTFNYYAHRKGNNLILHGPRQVGA